MRSLAIFPHHCAADHFNELTTAFPSLHIPKIQAGKKSLHELRPSFLPYLWVLARFVKEFLRSVPLALTRRSTQNKAEPSLDASAFVGVFRIEQTLGGTAGLLDHPRIVHQEERLRRHGADISSTVADAGVGEVESLEDLG
jgi:hypothetical protein